MGPIFDRYLFYLGGGFARGPTLVPAHARNSLVGMAESISGLSSLFLAIPVGLLVDKWPDKRARLLRLAFLFAVLATALAIFAVLTDIIVLMYLTLIMLGCFMELANSATEAIFADSIPAGKRSGFFTQKAILSTVGIACGPAISAVGLWFLGDKWEPYQMKAVILGGCLILPVCCVTLFFFDDPAASRQQPSEASGGETTEAAAGSTSPGRPARSAGPLKSRHVPYILALANFITACGAGMTVKFFNLFFIEDQKFSPIAICILQTAYPLVIACFMKGLEHVAKPLGRSQAALLFFSTNVLCLFLLSQLKNLPFLLLVYLVRGGFANGTSALDRSILMDYTPSSQRGRWNAVESFTSMTWSGSAFVGGLLSDSHDYRFTFAITALVYATSCVCYSPLLRLVPRREADAAAPEDRDPRQISLIDVAAASPDA